ncbi:MAG TPA: hypothetical protein VFU02_08770 [Polyangiaceae bacterium]|nr:hypothetical protein [Polyangiaceae bacterium]
MSPHVSRLICAGCLALWLLAGCDRLRRASQCERLADAVNGAMRSISNDTASITPASLHAGARHYEALSQALGPMQFSDRQMAIEVESFRRSLDSAAYLCQELAEDLDKNELAQAALHKRDLDALKGPMKSQAYRMNVWCREH